MKFNYTYHKELSKKYQLAICLNLREHFSDTQTLILSQSLYEVANSNFELVKLNVTGIAKRIGVHRSTVQGALKLAVQKQLLLLDENKEFKRYKFADSTEKNQHFTDVLLNYWNVKNKIGSKPKSVHIERVDLRQIPTGDQQLLGDYLRLMRVKAKLINNVVGIDANQDAEVDVKNYSALADFLHCTRQTAKEFLLRITQKSYLQPFRECGSLIIKAGKNLKNHIAKRAKYITEDLAAKQRKSDRQKLDNFRKSIPDEIPF